MAAPDVKPEGNPALTPLPQSSRLIGLFERPGEAATLQFDFKFNFKFKFKFRIEGGWPGLILTGKRLHYLMIAKGSTWESWSHTDSLVDFGLVPPAAITEARNVQHQITALLITTIRNLEAAIAQEEPVPPSNPPTESDLI